MCLEDKEREEEGMIMRYPSEPRDPVDYLQRRAVVALMKIARALLNGSKNDG